MQYLLTEEEYEELKDKKNTGPIRSAMSVLCFKYLRDMGLESCVYMGPTDRTNCNRCPIRGACVMDKKFSDPKKEVRNG